jgi:hypothetical protein
MLSAILMEAARPSRFAPAMPVPRQEARVPMPKTRMRREEAGAGQVDEVVPEDHEDEAHDEKEREPEEEARREVGVLLCPFADAFQGRVVETEVGEEAEQAEVREEEEVVPEDIGAQPVGIEHRGEKPDEGDDGR